MDALDSFHSYFVRKLYNKTSRNGDRLAEAEKLVDWDAFRLIIKAMYANDTPPGGPTQHRRGGDGEAAGAPAVVRLE